MCKCFPPLLIIVCKTITEIKIFFSCINCVQSCFMCYNYFFQTCNQKMGQLDSVLKTKVCRCVCPSQDFQALTGMSAHAYMGSQSQIVILGA